MANFAELAAAVAALSEQVAATEGTEASAVALINGFATQVTTAVEAALTADNAADDASIAAAKQAIVDVTARFNASAAVLGAAVASNQ
jgi:hypothetical protein